MYGFDHQKIGNTHACTVCASKSSSERLGAFHHHLNRKKNEENSMPEGMATPSSQISQNYLTCEKQRGVTCKIVVNCHDLHSDLKIENSKLGCE